MGAERRNMALSDQEKKTTAFHEAGHTLVARSLPSTDPIHKVTIIPRGMALGVTQTLPQEDRVSMDKVKAENMIAFMMGGRVAEEVVFNQKTTGAGNDIERATDVARRMVCEWGMSDILGPLSFGKKEEQIFLGREISQHRDYSEQTAQTIDREVRDLVERNYHRAKQIIQENIAALHRLADALLEYETIDGAEVDALIRGEKLVRAKTIKPIDPEPEGGGAAPAPVLA
jgi:cell division protease FtsH